MKRAAAALLVTCAMLVPAAAHARRLKISSKRDLVKARATLTRIQTTQATRPPRTQRQADLRKFALSIARAIVKDREVGAAGKGIFAGTDPATGARKVVHLELVSETGGVLTVKTQHVDGAFDGAPLTRQFVPQGTNPNVTRHVSTDGKASFLLVRGRGIFDFQDADFKGDPEKL